MGRNEFTEVYVNIRAVLNVRKEEVIQKIIDHDRAREDVRQKLEEANLTEPEKINKDTGLREDAMLKIHVVDAINLGPSQTTYVQMRQNEMQAKTKEV